MLQAVRRWQGGLADGTGARRGDARREDWGRNLVIVRGGQGRGIGALSLHDAADAIVTAAIATATANTTTDALFRCDFCFF